MAPRTFVIKRFDIGEGGHAFESGDGEYVKAQDAIDREAVLQADIRVLEVQLKDALKNVAVERTARYDAEDRLDKLGK